MERRPDQLQANDRRTFVKSVTTALVAAPLGLTVAEGRERLVPRAETSNCQPTSTEGPLTAVPCPHPRPHLGTETHEPPVIVTDGSLQMECEAQMLRKGAIASPPPISPRRHLYEFDQYLYGELLRLQVITLYQNVFTTECYDTHNASISFPTLKIWLQRFEEGSPSASGPGNPNDIDPGQTDAHIFFTYEANPDPMFSGRVDRQALVLETDKEFGPPTRGFTDRPTFKHHHGGYVSGEHFRIGRWMLLDSAGRLLVGNNVGTRTLSDSTVSTPSVSDVLGFYLVPHFFHLGDALKIERARRRLAPTRK